MVLEEEEEEEKNIDTDSHTAQGKEDAYQKESPTAVLKPIQDDIEKMNINDFEEITKKHVKDDRDKVLTKATIKAQSIAEDAPKVEEMEEEVDSSIDEKQQHHTKAIIQNYEINKRDEAMLNAVIEDCMCKDFIECKE